MFEGLFESFKREEPLESTGNRKQGFGGVRVFRCRLQYCVSAFKKDFIEHHAAVVPRHDTTESALGQRGNRSVRGREERKRDLLSGGGITRYVLRSSTVQKRSLSSSAAASSCLVSVHALAYVYLPSGHRGLWCCLAGWSSCK